MEISESFLSDEVPFKLTYLETLYLSDTLSIVRENDPLIHEYARLSFRNDTSRPYKISGVPASDSLIMKILYIISGFESSIDTHQIEMNFSFRELLEIREVAISNKMFNEEPVGKNLLSQVSFLIGKHAFTPIPEINESVVKEIDEIIENFEKRKEG